MAKKRGRRVSHRRARHRVRAQKEAVSSKIRTTKANIRIVLNNLIVFFILFLISLILYEVLQSEVLNNLFFIFMLGFGFISVAFLITLVVFLFLKLLQKRR
ncbi:MAG: hypothetical protein PHH00_02660 [Candidatus Nanoarchaeia archaeon]|nr:hypothetical protein [Candidatus Nanoarchaeia archaeon]